MDFGFRFASCLGLRDTILKSKAFEPPNQPNYEFYKDTQGTLRMMTLSDPKDDQSIKIKAEDLISDSP